ncbi:MAG: SAM-dependent methyltransferase [Parcubacteria group bacterium Gr01-1014_29]|nr:MAG: SAM-dependent methyltransferase [Parcubacteria group bacterium Gr01-1014_29]
MSFLNPTITAQSLDILPGMRIVDFGCGSGHWAVSLAKATGPAGKVFAIDIQESALEATRAQARYAHLQNIETIRANVERAGGIMLKDGTVDAVMISNMLFQADEKAVVVAQAARILKPHGRVFLIEWDETESLAGPPASQRISRQTAEQLFGKEGLRMEKEFNAGAHHYGLIFRKT